MPVSPSALDAANGNAGKPAYELLTFDNGLGGPRAGASVLVDADAVPIDDANPLPVVHQGTMQVDAAALPLPTGAATELTAEAVTELLQEVCIRLADIADSVGNLMPDTAGRIRVAAETLGTLSTITTVTTVATVTNMANQTNIGGFAANQHMMALTQMAEQALRQNIVIS
jgi:hypothetical protein